MRIRRFRGSTAAAVGLLLTCLRYFGVELPDVFRRGKEIKLKKREPSPFKVQEFF
jgi:hypothetical protein